MSLLLGCIADDFTGATDLASMLVRQGMATVQLIGVPGAGVDPGDAQAVVVALKSRTISADEAVRQSLAALGWLRAQGAGQVLFKYCSTFDSTDRGNIGPVSEALLEALGADLTIACPALPENGRTVYQGHLFVGEQAARRHPHAASPADPDDRRQSGRGAAAPEPDAGRAGGLCGGRPGRRGDPGAVRGAAPARASGRRSRMR